MILLFFNYLLELSRVKKNERGYVKKAGETSPLGHTSLTVIFCSTGRFPALLFKGIF